MDLKNKEIKKPWYKYPIVWFVISLPTIAVIASFITLMIAANNAPEIIKSTQSTKFSDIESKK